MKNKHLSPHTHTSTPSTKLHTPWYLQLILGFSGWLAGGFLVGFLVLTFTGLDQGFVTLGLILMVAAAIMLFVNRQKSNDFLENLALSISVAGQACFVFGIIGNVFSYDKEYVLFIMAILQICLVFVMFSFLHRLASACLASVLFYYYLGEVNYSFSQSFIFLIALLGVSLLGWFQMQRPLWQNILKPITYGITLAVLGIYVWIVSKGFYFSKINNQFDYLMVLPSMLLFAVAWLVVWHLFKRYQLHIFSLHGMLAGLAILIFTVVDYYSLGIMVSLLYLLVGFAQSQRLLQGIAILTLLGFISRYYYMLEVSLLHKSILLAALGLVLLLVRFSLQKLNLLSAQESTQGLQGGTHD